MKTNHSSISVECLDCQTIFPFDLHNQQCPNCGSLWREARYDLARTRLIFDAQLPRRQFNLWRYLELLPIPAYLPYLDMGEGGTPLIHAKNIGLMLGCTNLYIKDERQGPTNSFKDRQAALSVAAMKHAGITEAVLASTGNVAIAYSAYAARAGIKLWAFLTSMVPMEKMREVAVYGTKVIQVTGTYDEAKRLAAEFARQKNLHLERGACSIPSIESMKTIAFEISEQLPYGLSQAIDRPNSLPDTNKWLAPDWYIQAVSGGIGPLGVQKGFSELEKMGYIPKIPAMACIQAEGCSPMVQAWKAGQNIAIPVTNPATHIATLSTGDPGRTYTLLYDRFLQAGGGVFESVTDEETFHTVHILAKLEGISVEPAAAVAFAGLFKLIRNRRINPADIIVVNCTGHTMPVETFVLGDNWSVNVTAPSQTPTAKPQEGLFSALSHLQPDTVRKIIIIDDIEEARRLLRRILQSQGDFIITEAESGPQAIQMIKQDPPDIIILDLMMPEMDGFQVMEELQNIPAVSSIPIIVVTAKELTQQEQIILKSRASGLMRKGSFVSEDLTTTINNVLLDKSNESTS
jgi:threonine synthase